MGNLKVQGIEVDAGGLVAGRDLAADGSKIDNVQSNATQNDTDANLRDRSTHTGTQLASTISDFDVEVSNNTDVTANTAKVSFPEAPLDGQQYGRQSGAWSLISGSAFDPVAEGVLTDYESDSITATTVSTQEFPAATVYWFKTFTGLDVNATYEVTFGFIESGAAANTSVKIDLKGFGVSVLPQVYSKEPKDPNDRIFNTTKLRLQPQVASGGQFQFQVDLSTTNAGNAATMYYAFLSIAKIN